MQQSNAPSKISVAFAESGAKNTIPTASQIGIVDGAASFTDGFPPLTSSPISAGGVPPSRLDMNGVLYSLSAASKWNAAGGGYAYDAAFSSAVSGYPKGARVLRADGLGYWMSVADGNTTDPDGGSPANWVPDVSSGIASVTMTSSNVTLTPAQYGMPIIKLQGTLTANLNLTFPAIGTEWVVINGCTGAYSVTCKTASGTGVAIPTGRTRTVVGDGTNLVAQDAGALLNVQTFTSSGTYTPTAGTTSIIVEVQAAGGGSGGCVATSASQLSYGGGGGAGTFVKARITSGFSGAAVTIGSAGAAGAAGAAGGNGGATSFGSLVSCPGGNGGAAGAAITASQGHVGFSGGAKGGAPTISGATALQTVRGAPAGFFHDTATSTIGSAGGSSPHGNGGAPAVINGAVDPANGYGAGAAGPVNGPSQSAKVGAAGTPGFVVIYEYS